MPLCLSFLRSAARNRNPRAIRAFSSTPALWQQTLRERQRSNITDPTENKPDEDSRSWTTGASGLQALLDRYAPPAPRPQLSSIRVKEEALDKSASEVDDGHHEVPLYTPQHDDQPENESPTDTDVVVTSSNAGRMRSPQARRLRSQRPFKRNSQSRFGHTRQQQLRSRIIAQQRAGTRRRKNHRIDLSAYTATRTTGVYSTAWSTRSIRLRLTFDENSKQAAAYPLEFESQVSAWAEAVLEEMADAAVRKRPLRMDAIARRFEVNWRDVWCEVALWLLRFDADKILDFIMATNAPLYPPINWVEDCLQIRVLQLQSKELSEPEKRAEMIKLTDALFAVLDRDTEEHLVFSSSFIALLLPHVGDQQVQQIWQCIKNTKIKVKYGTMLHFAKRFVDGGQLQNSLDAALEAARAGADVNHVSFRSACASLLRKSMAHSDGLRVCLRLIENLVGIGVKLNRQLCNIVMLNAVEAGDDHTASAVHHSAIEQGLEPNAYTYAILLKQCKQHIKDGERLRRVIEEAITNGHVRGNTVVATEILHCLALHHFVSMEGDNPWAATKAVSEAFCQLFDPSPLERMGIPLPSRVTVDPANERMPPSPQAIGILVAVMVNAHEHLGKASAWYARWRELVMEGDKDLLPCAGTDHLSNIFLQHFGRRFGSLLDATHVVRDMQTDLPEVLSEATGIYQAKPTVHTWSIYLTGFRRNNRHQLAEQVLQYMTKKGVKPNRVTWTSLLAGYVGAQDAEGVLDTLRRMESSGYAFDSWTDVTLGPFRQKDRLRAVLEKDRLQKSLDFTGDLKEGLEQKLREAGGQGDSGVSAPAEAEESPVDTEEGVMYRPLNG